MLTSLTLKGEFGACCGAFSFGPWHVRLTGTATEQTAHILCDETPGRDHAGRPYSSQGLPLAATMWFTANRARSAN